VTDRSTPPVLARPASAGGAAGLPGGGLLLRVLPTGLYVGRARVLVERSLLVNRRSWMTVFSGFFEPVFYLLALGPGLGALIGGEIAGPAGQQLSYAAFIAPGLLAASAMNGAVYDSTLNVFFKIKYARLYDAMLATPLGPVDVALGEIGWALLRGELYATGFLAVMFVLGLTTSAWALLVLPVALLVGFAFAAVGMATTTFMRSWQDFDLVQLVLLPMFLFSTTFFPLSVYPPAVRFVVACFPLYHAIELMRAFTSGAVGWGLLGHLCYFVLMAAVGTLVASRRLVILLLR